MTRPAKHFDKLSKQRKRDHESIMVRDQRIAALEAELKATAIARDSDIKKALDTQKAHHDEDWRHAKEHHDAARDRALNAERELNETKAELESARNSLHNCKIMLNMDRARLAETEPQLVMISQQRTELEHILDTVRDRMRRSECDKERAILNRKVIANARPDFNRR